MNIQVGIQGKQTEVVKHENTAAYYGSGLVEVFATPAMIALMEKTCYTSVLPCLKDGEGTVGTNVNVSHKKASPIGITITCTSELVEIDRRKLVFKVLATDNNGEIVGEGYHERFIIDVNNFLKKL